MAYKLLTVTDETQEYILKTNNRFPVYLTQTEYSAEDYARILDEAQEWNIEIEHSEGCDADYDEDAIPYSYSTYSHSPIEDSILVVEDGHFAGVLMLFESALPCTDFSKEYKDLVVTFTKDYIPRGTLICARNNMSHLCSNSAKWNIYFNYLKKKVDNRE